MTPNRLDQLESRIADLARQVASLTEILQTGEPPEPSTEGVPELPFPIDCPPSPPLPEGTTRWRYLGKFSDLDTTPAPENTRFHDGYNWYNTDELSCNYHHIQAI